MSNNRFKEQANTHNAVSTYAITTKALGGESSDIMKTAFYDIENYDAILGLAVIGTVSSGDTVTLKMWQGTDTDGAGSATITGASATYVSTQTTDDAVYAIEVDADLLTDGYDFVGLEASTSLTDGTEVVALAVIPSNARYPQATPVA